MLSYLISCTWVTPGDPLARPRHEVDRSLPDAPSESRLGKFKLSEVALRGQRNYARAERVEGLSMVGAAWALKPLPTDSVNRGLCISLFKLETISLAISIRLFFFMKRSLFER